MTGARADSEILCRSDLLLRASSLALFLIFAWATTDVSAQTSAGLPGSGGSGSYWLRVVFFLTYRCPAVDEARVFLALAI